MATFSFTLLLIWLASSLQKGCKGVSSSSTGCSMSDSSCEKLYVGGEILQSSYLGLLAVEAL